MPDTQILNPLNYPGWDDIVLSTESYSFFDSSYWAWVLSESYGYKPLYFCKFDNKRLLALIPFMEIRSIPIVHKGVSLPFSDYCEPIFLDKIFFQELWSQIINYGKKAGWKYVELRGGKKFFQDTPPSICYYGHTLDLAGGEEKIFSAFRDSTRRNVKKAVKEGVEVIMCFSMDSVKEFYRLNCMTRKNHGLPPQPFYFFKNVYDHVISKNKGMVALAFYKKKVIASAVYLHFGDKVLYKYGASDYAYQNLRPNNLILWEAIKWYSNHGYKCFSLGRTDPANEGLRNFKKGWGVKEHIITYYKYGLKKGAFVSDSSVMLGVHNKILNKMPIPILKIISLFLYKHIG